MKENLRCQLISLQEVYELSFSLAQQILASSFRPDVVIAISRGGFVPARFLCDFLDVKAMTSVSIRHYVAAATKNSQAEVLYPLTLNLTGKKVLIADDVNDSGDTLRVAIDHVATFSPAELHTAVLHEKVNSDFRVSYKAQSLTEWRWVIYPWAVVEDVGGLMLREYADLTELDVLRERLFKSHGLDICEEILKKIKTIHFANKTAKDTEGYS